MSLQGQRTTTSAMDWNDFRSLVAKLERDKEFKFCLLISIGCFTGLRIGDLLQLRFSQIEDSDILSIRERKTANVRRIKNQSRSPSNCRAGQGENGSHRFFKVHIPQQVLDQANRSELCECQVERNL